MLSVRSIADDIVAREGGYVDDPDDPGGPTNYGVTIRTLRALGLDLNADGDVDLGDLRRLTPDQAADIFVDHYFRRPRIAMLPGPLQASVFDMYVNAGSNAVRILQRLLRDMGFDLAVDGVIGPLTARAAHRALAQAPDHLVDAYGIARGAITITRSATAARPAANSPRGAMAARGAGSCGPKPSSRPGST